LTEPLKATRDAIRAAERSYERFVLLVGPAGCGKTGILQALEAELGTPRVNANLVISPRLLNAPVARRAAALPGILDDLFANGTGLLLLDNLEVLFDPALRFSPLTWLRQLGRLRTIVAAWNGSLERGHLTHAVVGHPEYRREPLGETWAVLMAAGGSA
jgi:hypothetical protein